jgi:hypothetical protein
MLKYKDLQPWVEMLVDALENHGSSSSGMPDILVYPYANEYRTVLKQIRNKELSKYQLDCFLDTTYDKVMSVTTQKYRVSKILEGIKIYFYNEFMK